MKRVLDRVYFVLVRRDLKVKKYVSTSAGLVDRSGPFSSWGSRRDARKYRKRQFDKDRLAIHTVHVWLVKKRR